MLFHISLQRPKQNRNLSLNSQEAPHTSPNLCVNFGEQGKSEGFDSCDWPTKSYSNWIQITNFSPCVTFKFDGWPWKTVGHLFYTMSSFAHHFKTIGEFKLKLQSRNAQFGSKSAIFCPCDLEIWWITSERASLLQYVKLCALFERHPWIQIRVTVQKRSIRVKICNFLSCVTLKFDGWPWKTIGHLFYAASSFLHHFIAFSEFKLGLQSGNAQFGSKSVIFFPMWSWNLTDDLEKQSGTSSMLLKVLCIIS